MDSLKIERFLGQIRRPLQELCGCGKKEGGVTPLSLDCYERFYGLKGRIKATSYKDVY